MKGAFTPNAVWHMPEALSFSLLIKDFPEDFLFNLSEVLLRGMSHFLMLYLKKYPLLFTGIPAHAFLCSLGFRLLVIYTSCVQPEIWLIWLYICVFHLYCTIYASVHRLNVT